MTVVRRRRLQDGSFGPLEKVFEGETKEEKIERLEREKEELKQSIAELSAIVSTITPERR